MVITVFIIEYKGNEKVDVNTLILRQNFCAFLTKFERKCLILILIKGVSIKQNHYFYQKVQYNLHLNYKFGIKYDAFLLLWC